MGSLCRTAALFHLQAAESGAIDPGKVLNAQYVARCTLRSQRFESSLVRIEADENLGRHLVFAIKFHHWQMPDRLLVIDLLWRFCGKHRRFVQGLVPNNPKDAWHFRWFVDDQWQPFCSFGHHRTEGGWISLGAVEDAMIGIRADNFRPCVKTHLRAC